MHPPLGKWLSTEHLSQMELSQMIPQIVRNKTHKGHRGHHYRHKNRELSLQGKVQFCRRECVGAQAQQARGAGNGPHFYP
jgi:hypothetical protein